MIIGRSCSFEHLDNLCFSDMVEMFGIKKHKCDQARNIHKADNLAFKRNVFSVSRSIFKELTSVGVVTYSTSVLR